MQPIVMISSYPPRLCGIATFCEEAREFIQKANPNRPVYIICHTDGRGEGVFPVIDTSKRNWWEPVAEQVESLQPYVVHIEHEYGLYEHVDDRGVGDGNDGFLDLLEAISDFAVVVEPHTVHGRLTDFEANFIYRMCEAADVVFFKCHYQKWRLQWTFPGQGWEVPRNIMVVPHGSRPDRRWGIRDVPALRKEIGLDQYPYVGDHLVGLVGWIQSNKRWDILTSMWEDLAGEIEERTGRGWDLLAAGAMRDPNDRREYERYRGQVELLERRGLAHYYEFVPRGDSFYKVLAVCDFIVLPSIDETQSGTLARIVAVNKPYVTTAPMEGLTAQTLESGGGLLFTTKDMLAEKVVRLACDERLRLELGEHLRRYLEDVVSWEVVSRQYGHAYRLARQAKAKKTKVEFAGEF